LVNDQREALLERSYFSYVVGGDATISIIYLCRGALVIAQNPTIPQGPWIAFGCSIEIDLNATEGRPREDREGGDWRVFDQRRRRKSHILGENERKENDWL